MAMNMKIESSKTVTSLSTIPPVSQVLYLFQLCVQQFNLSLVCLFSLCCLRLFVNEKKHDKNNETLGYMPYRTALGAVHSTLRDTLNV